MEYYLPTKRFAWVTIKNLLDYTEKEILNLSDDSPYGFILSVDLDYPDELHRDHNCLPLAPESKQITTDMFSPHYKLLMRENGLTVKDTMSKLVTDLTNKRDYIIHYRNLKYYLSLGMKLKRVNRVLTFEQAPWIKPYINFNTVKRMNSTNSFEKDYFKLMNNSVFG